MKHLPLLLLLGGLLSASAARSADPVRYVDAATLTVIGKALPTEQPYNRIDTTRFRVPAKTPGYCYHPTGLAVVFRTDSRTIRARWETSGKNPSDNMAAVAQKGLDLYIRNNGEWVFAGVGRPKINGKNDRHDAAIISNMAEGEKECLLYLPLYDQLKKLEIGVDEKSVITPMENPFRHKIVVHGSSITHGIAAGRAGMAYSSRLGRDTGLYCINGIQRTVHHAARIRIVSVPRRSRRLRLRLFLESQRRGHQRTFRRFRRYHPPHASHHAADFPANHPARNPQLQHPD